MKALLKKILNVYPDYSKKNEFNNQYFTRFNERAVEFSFVFRQISQICPKTILDVGTGTTALPHLIRNCGPLVTAVDNVKDYWPNGMTNRHYHIINDDIIKTKLKAKFDMITCISVLEHIEQFDAAVANMIKLLNPGGHLIITCPYTDDNYVKNVYDLEDSSYGKGNPFVAQSYSGKNLSDWLKNGNAAVVEQEYWQFWDGKYWTCGKQIIPPVKVSVNERHQISCILIKKNN